MASLPALRKAIAIEKTGDFDVIQLLDLPLTPGPGDIVIKTEYMGLNFVDTSIRSGRYPLPINQPMALGCEISGTIVALPTDESVLEHAIYKKHGFSVGARVVACGGIVYGIHSDYAAVPWAIVTVIPQGVSTRAAAAASAQATTALAFVDQAHNVQKGETILVHTVAGGVGLFFAQLIKARGATVIGTTSTKEKAELAKAHGADHVVLYKEEDTVQRVLELTGGRGVDAVFDGVGKDTFDNNFKLLKVKGTLVCVGSTSGYVPPFAPRRLLEKNLKLVNPTLRNYASTPEELYQYSTELLALLASNTVRVHVHKEYPFTVEGAIQAQKDLAGGQTAGKVLIKVD
ncbi:NAD-binding protein [Roridomyces roridus]|uniref:Probable quinone oxidoreductase n=1 Tax=Roridomyces roridus TaxID=1738132 RepID=A0AAD7BN79_9AGAR|nr:NAD-binding protein [Roridomyces roridus]